MDAEDPESSPLSAVPDDLEDLDDSDFVATHNDGGPVHSTDKTPAEQSLVPHTTSTAEKEDKPALTPIEVDTNAPIEQGDNDVQYVRVLRPPRRGQTDSTEIELPTNINCHASGFNEGKKNRDSPKQKRKAPTLKAGSPPPAKTRRQSTDKKPSSSAEHLPEVSSGELESPINISQRETPMMEREKTLEARAPRTSRRKAPSTYVEPDSDAEFEETVPTKGKKTANTSDKPKRGGVTWTPDYLLQDPKSKLGKVNVTAILKDPRAWDTLSKEQQSQLIGLLPNAPVIDPESTKEDNSLPNIPQQMLTQNSALLSDVAMFGEDLREGRLDPDWQREGQIAMEKRARGDFDDWKVQETEAFWGQKQKLQHDVVAGESSKIKLEELVREGIVQVGDVWLYKRTFGRAKDSTVMEKEATVVSITDDHKLVFRFPPGTAKFSSPSAGEDIVTGPLSGPQQLSDAMIKEDGRITEWRNNNAWKEYRCIRNQNDLGSLWERREIYWAKTK